MIRRFGHPKSLCEWICGEINLERLTDFVSEKVAKMGDGKGHQRSLYLDSKEFLHP